MRLSLRNIIHQLPQHLTRVRSARFYGIPFSRRASFVMPTQIHGKEFSIPADQGAGADFLACFVDDCYGLARESKERGSAPTTILDIGANAGFFSMAARLRFPNATIHAYEPNPRIASIIQSNATAFGFTYYNEALGSQAGHVRMVDEGPSNFASTKMDESGEVPLIGALTAAERLGGQIDFLKLDAEGAEWDLLKVPEFWERVRKLRMEYHEMNGNTLADLQECLHAFGLRTIHTEPVAETCGVLWADRARVGN